MRVRRAGAAANEYQPATGGASGAAWARSSPVAGSGSRNAEIASSPRSMKDARAAVALGSTGWDSTRSFPAASVTGMCGPPQGQPSRLPRREGQCLQMFRGQKGRIPKARRGVVEGQRIEVCDFHAADSGRLHLFQFTRQFGPGCGGSKPPPAHHDAARIGRIGKIAMQCGDCRRRLSRREWRDGECSREQGDCRATRKLESHRRDGMHEPRGSRFRIGSEH
jgi:hypothetical protein